MFIFKDNRFSDFLYNLGLFHSSIEKSRYSNRNTNDIDLMFSLRKCILDNPNATSTGKPLIIFGNLNNKQ